MSQKSMSSFHANPEMESNIEKMFEGPERFHIPDTSVQCDPQQHHYDESDYMSKSNWILGLVSENNKC